MTMTDKFAATEPSREDIDNLSKPTVLEFGAPWCGFCQAAQPLLATAFAGHPDVDHIKIEDGKGRRLGRSFSVKLWPTLIFLSQGKEVGRVVRPANAAAIEQGLAQIDRPAS